MYSVLHYIVYFRLFNIIMFGWWITILFFTYAFSWCSAVALWHGQFTPKITMGPLWFFGEGKTYRKVSNISRTKSQNLNAPRLIL